MTICCFLNRISIFLPIWQNLIQALRIWWWWRHVSCRMNEINRNLTMWRVLACCENGKFRNSQVINGLGWNFTWKVLVCLALTVHQHGKYAGSKFDMQQSNILWFLWQYYQSYSSFIVRSILISHRRFKLFIYS